MVEKGFKLTEIGMIPEDWEVSKLGNCLLEKPKYGIGAAAVKYDDTLPTYLRITDISEEGSYLSNDQVSVSHPMACLYYLDKGEIVFARTGASVGKTYHYECKDGKLVFAGFLIRVKPDLSMLNSYFLKFFVQTKTYWSWIIANSMRSGQPGINSQQLETLPIPLPPLHEQTAIATALSDMDALIAQTEKLIEKKKAIKQGVMQELLRPKEGWVTKKLGEVANCFAGGTPSTFNREFWGGKIPWLPSGRVKNNIIKPIENEITITDLGLSSSAAKMIKPNSILMAITGATCGNIGLLTFSAAANQSVVSIEKNDEFDSVLMYYILLTMRDDILRLQTGSAQGGVNLKAVKAIEVKIPEKIGEQNEISQILWDFDKEIESYNKKLTKLKLQKQGMMQALLMGKIRLI